MIRKNFASPTVTEMCDRIQTWADDHYRHAAEQPGAMRQPTREALNIRDALKTLRELHGHKNPMTLEMEDFEACQRLLIDRNLAYTTINGRMKRIRTSLEEARRMKIITTSVIDEAKLVRTLKSGRSDAKEPKPKQEITQDQITDVILLASESGDYELSVMLELHSRTGMRPCELVAMKRSELSYCTVKLESGEDARIMIYEPGRHKNSWRGSKHKRKIAIGPEALAFLESWLKRLDWYKDHPDRYRGQNHDRVWRYSRTNSYSNAIRKMVRVNNKDSTKPYVAPICVQMIRSYFASWFCDATKLETTKEVLGHKSVTTTEIYVRHRQLSSWSKMAELG